MTIPAYREETASAKEASDEHLMRLACAGDEAAFAALVRRYERPLFGFAHRMLADTGEAEDVFQETCLRVYRSLDRFRGGSLFRPWVYRIAANLCRDRLRRRALRRVLSLDALWGESGDARPLAETVPSPNPGPAALAAADETAARIEAAIERLSAKHRTVFLMARYQGLSYEEIAAALEIPVGTVKSRMKNAVDQLMREVEGPSP